jgi:hypothetical protein
MLIKFMPSHMHDSVPNTFIAQAERAIIQLAEQLKWKSRQELLIVGFPYDSYGLAGFGS